MKNLILLLIFSASAWSADVKTLTTAQKTKLSQTLKIFDLAANRPELWSAVLEDLREFKNTKGKGTIVNFFKGKMKRDLANYSKKFQRAAEEYQKNIFRKHEKDFAKSIAEAKKVFKNVNKESTSKSWGHMNSVKSQILPGAGEILESNADLRLLRKRLKGLDEMLAYFQEGDAMKLEDFEELTVSRSIPYATGEAKSIMAANEKANIPTEIKKGIRDLNVMRLIFGMNALTADVKLCECSADHSKDMKEKGFFAHESPVKGKKTPWVRAKNFGTSANGENIAMGSRTAEGSNRQWFHSPGHFKNMFSSKNRIGLGQYGKYWTQMLGN